MLATSPNRDFKNGISPSNDRAPSAEDDRSRIVNILIVVRALAASRFKSLNIGPSGTDLHQ
jgi:hypothetical protein